MKKIVLIITMALTTLGNAFTYQGELSQTGSLVTGTADMKFSLLNTDSGGSMVGGVDLHTAVVISNGRFVVDLDQWVALYDGTPLWLQIEVDIGSTGSFTTLSPRQKLQPAPYSEYAYDAAGGSNGDITGVVAGTGLTGGGSSGEITLNIDSTAIQSRVLGSCSSGESIKAINQDGTVLCEGDSDSGGDITAVTAGVGLIGGGVSGSVSLTVNPLVFQKRINATCPAGQSIRSIDEDGLVTCEIDDSLDSTTIWSTTGNSGTDSNTDFIGTTDTQELVIKVGNKRVMLFQPKSGLWTNNIIGGNSGNIITGNSSHGSIIAGGGSFADSICGINNDENCVNKSSSVFTTISGGKGNQVHEYGGVIAGGSMNIINTFAYRGVISGGEDNFSDGTHAVVSGGQLNTSAGGWSTVSGGHSNYAGGKYSWAGGASAIVRDQETTVLTGGDEGTFVWDGDADTQYALTSTDSGQFLVRAPGGMWLGNGTGNLFPDTQSSALLINSEFTTIPLTIRHDTSNVFQVQTNGGTSIGSDTAADANGLRVSGETNLMGRLGVGVTSPNSTLHVDSSLSVGLRVQINGNSKLKVLNNGGVAIGSDYTTVPTNGMKVKGDVEIVGVLTHGTGVVKMDHPKDPANKYLNHNAVISSDMMNIYNGNIVTDKFGEAWVEMPDWFEALNMEFRYQLTVIGSFDRAMIAEEIIDNKFLIRTESGQVKVSWQVTGIRHDVWAEKNRTTVEEEKQEQDKGHYLHPEAWNVDKKLAIGYSEE